MGLGNGLRCTRGIGRRLAPYWRAPCTVVFPRGLLSVVARVLPEQVVVCLGVGQVWLLLSALLRLSGAGLLRLSDASLLRLRLSLSRVIGRPFL